MESYENADCKITDSEKSKVANTKKNTLRKAYEKIITSETTMAKRLRLDDIMHDSDEDSAATLNGVESMKSNLWSGKQKNTPPKKRRRTQARGDAKPMAPADVPYERFKEMLICMAYAGANSKFNFLDWIRNEAPADSHGNLGIRVSSIAPVIDCFCSPTTRLHKTMAELARISQPGCPTSQLYIYLQEMLITHQVTYSTQIEEHGMQCAINNKPPKGNNKLVLFQLKRHEVRKGEIKEDGSYQTDFFEPYLQDTRFVVSTQYDKILFGFWWILDLEYLIAHNCRKWIELVRELPSEDRRELFPEFASASDSELAQLYVNENDEDCRTMYANMLEYTNIIEKHNKTMENRKTELLKKAK